MKAILHIYVNKLTFANLCIDENDSFTLWISVEVTNAHRRQSFPLPQQLLFPRQLLLTPPTRRCATVLVTTSSAVCATVVRIVPVVVIVVYPTEPT